MQELVKLHGGNVRVESEIDRGSSFIVSIPRGKSHLPGDRIEVERSQASTGTRSDAYVEELLRWLPDSARRRLWRGGSEIHLSEAFTVRILGRREPRGRSGFCLWMTMPTCAPTFGGCLRKAVMRSKPLPTGLTPLAPHECASPIWF